jgi:hypothetical protein
MYGLCQFGAHAIGVVSIEMPECQTQRTVLSGRDDPADKHTLSGISITEPPA